MSTEKKLFKKVVRAFCTALIAFTPIIISGTASLFFFGEPECPQHLKNQD
ncbi:MAG: AgrD family cyclic lactone autoinducer peptide [Eubacteriales bacterium]